MYLKNIAIFVTLSFITITCSNESTKESQEFHKQVPVNAETQQKIKEILRRIGLKDLCLSEFHDQRAATTFQYKLEIYQCPEWCDPKYEYSVWEFLSSFSDVDKSKIATQLAKTNIKLLEPMVATRLAHFFLALNERGNSYFSLPEKEVLAHSFLQHHFNTLPSRYIHKMMNLLPDTEKNRYAHRLLTPVKLNDFGKSVAEALSNFEYKERTARLHETLEKNLDALETHVAATLIGKLEEGATKSAYAKHLITSKGIHRFSEKSIGTLFHNMSERSRNFFTEYLFEHFCTELQPRAALYLLRYHMRYNNKKWHYLQKMIVHDSNFLKEIQSTDLEMIGWYGPEFRMEPEEEAAWQQVRAAGSEVRCSLLEHHFQILPSDTLISLILDFKHTAEGKRYVEEFIRHGKLTESAAFFLLVDCIPLPEERKAFALHLLSQWFYVIPDNQVETLINALAPEHQQFWREKLNARMKEKSKGA